MTQADSVHSTPPTNTSAIDQPQSPTKPHSRRSVLGAIAAATAAVTVAGARPTDAAPTIDPIYAAIKRHKACAVKLDAAVHVRARFNDCQMNDEQKRQFQILVDTIDQATERCEAAGIDLFNTAPTTPAGIVAAIRYIQIQYRNDGAHMPCGEMQAADGTECGDWLECFLDTLAGAAAA
jgi:TrbM